MKQKEIKVLMVALGTHPFGCGHSFISASQNGYYPPIFCVKTENRGLFALWRQFGPICNYFYLFC